MNDNLINFTFIGINFITKEEKVFVVKAETRLMALNKLNQKHKDWAFFYHSAGKYTA